MKSLIICLILLPYIFNAQCITKKNISYVIGDPAVKVYPDNSHVFEKVDTLAGLLTWTLDPCIKYKVFSDQMKKHLVSEYYFVEDTVIAKYYYPNGKIRLIDKEVGKDHLYIYTAVYYDNGQILYADNPNSFEARTIVQYHSNGKPKKEFLLWGMGCWGTIKTWYSSGKIQSIEEFSKLSEQDQMNNSTSKKDGLWQYWDENGKLIKQITYKDDLLVKEENFN